MLISSLLFGISASLDALLVGISYGIRKIRIRFWQNIIISLITLLGTCLSVGLGHKLIPFLPTAVQGCVGSLILILLGLYYIVKWVITSLQCCRPKAPLDADQLPEMTSASAREASGAEEIPSARNKSSSNGASSARSTDCQAETLSADISASAENISSEGEAAPPRKPSPQLKLIEVFALSLTLSLNNLSAGLSASLAGLTLLPTAVSTLICSVLFLFSGNRLGQNPILQLAGRTADPLSGALLIGLGVVQFFI